MSASTDFFQNTECAILQKSSPLGAQQRFSKNSFLFLPNFIKGIFEILWTLSMTFRNVIMISFKCQELYLCFFFFITGLDLVKAQNKVFFNLIGGLNHSPQYLLWDKKNIAITSGFPKKNFYNLILGHVYNLELYENDRNMKKSLSFNLNILLISHFVEEFMEKNMFENGKKNYCMNTQFFINLLDWKFLLQLIFDTPTMIISQKGWSY